GIVCSLDLGLLGDAGGLTQLPGISAGRRRRKVGVLGGGRRVGPGVGGDQRSGVGEGSAVVAGDRDGRAAAGWAEPSLIGEGEIVNPESIIAVRGPLDVEISPGAGGLGGGSGQRNVRRV